MSHTKYLHAGKVGPAAEGKVAFEPTQQDGGTANEATTLLEFSTSEDEAVDYDDLPRRRGSGSATNMPNWIKTARNWTVNDQKMLMDSNSWKPKTTLHYDNTVVYSLKKDKGIAPSVGYRVDTDVVEGSAYLQELLSQRFADRLVEWSTQCEACSVAVQLHDDTQILNLSYASEGLLLERRDCVCVKCVRSLDNGGFIVSYRCIEHPSIDPLAITNAKSHVEVCLMGVPHTDQEKISTGTPSLRLSYFRRIRHKKCVSRFLRNRSSPQYMLRELSNIKRILALGYDDDD